MPRLSEVCRHVRSKNAGPFWVTVDLFFNGAEPYRRYHDHPALGTHAVARLFAVDPAHVKRFSVDALHVVKISFPRPSPQGGIVERDMHGGQLSMRLIDLELG